MIYGLIGEKLGHSYSKEIHRELGQESYELYELKQDRVEAFVKRSPIGGLNVTIPYKIKVMSYCDILSESAKSIGSVNTLVYDGEGRLHGYNTDYDGFMYMVKKAGIAVGGKKVLILGAGGASLTARAAVGNMGAREIVVASRKEGMDALFQHRDSDIIVNTTPVGMYPHTPQSLISLSDFPCCSGLVDVIYNPFRTELVHQAMERGIPVTGGLPMLAAQAKAAEELFTGENISDEELERIIKKLRISRENIVLIGMPGSGKTSIGRAVAEKLGREFVDLDLAIEEQENRSVSHIFDHEGEGRFRRLETAMAAEYGKKNGIVIATGGGAVLKEENYLLLKQNGRIFHIVRPLEKLSVCDRPLSKSLEALGEMYEIRRPQYLRFADCAVHNDGSIDDAAKRLIGAFLTGE